MSPERVASRRQCLHLKGESGEELFAAVLVIIMIIGFILAINAAYGQWVDSQALIYSARTASSVAERMFYNNSGIMLSGCGALANEWDLSGVRVNMIWWEDSIQKNCTFGSSSAERILSISRMPMLFGSNGRLYAGYADVGVGV